MMELSRRDVLRLTSGTATGTALGGLVGLGADLGPTVARAQELRIKAAQTVPSVCPYCSVGCGTLIHTVEGRVVNIEGDPRSPHSEGTLCPKGAAIYQLHVNPNRPTRVLHRAPGGTEWEVWDLERAMDRVAELVRTTRDETFLERLPSGKLVNMTPAIFSLGGATLDNEWSASTTRRAGSTRGPRWATRAGSRARPSPARCQGRSPARRRLRAARAGRRAVRPSTRWCNRSSRRRRGATRRSGIRAAPCRSSSGTSAATRRRWWSG